ncbi:MAG TPA: hypothetical protein VKU01_12690 [Bryobacteraceae bacterium]|nr:hypothetical protein [Bryobacteraceae bacterium]
MTELTRLLNLGSFEAAISVAGEQLRSAATKSPLELEDVGRSVAAWRGFFANRSQAAASVPYFEAVFRLLTELAGPESGPAIAAADNLANVLASLDRLDDAFPLKLKVYAYVCDRFPVDDRRCLEVRDSLSSLCRRSGNTAAAEELSRDTGICEHLLPVENALRHRGKYPNYIGQPWSQNCHIWVYFNVVLDCERLIAMLNLHSCVQVHDHRGTHDGSERGLVCSVHNDGVMGLHPSQAEAATEIFPE